MFQAVPPKCFMVPWFLMVLISSDVLVVFWFLWWNRSFSSWCSNISVFRLPNFPGFCFLDVFFISTVPDVLWCSIIHPADTFTLKGPDTPRVWGEASGEPSFLRHLHVLWSVVNISPCSSVAVVLFFFPLVLFSYISSVMLIQNRPGWLTRLVIGEPSPCLTFRWSVSSDSKSSNIADQQERWNGLAGDH